MRRSVDSVSEIASFALLTVVLYFAAQAVIVVLHEHAHSTAAWLLGYMSTPFTVVWGNPLTILGWDEGVPYDRLFPSPGHPAEAVLGGIPLLMHSLFAVFGLYYLQRPLLTRRDEPLAAVICVALLYGPPFTIQHGNAMCLRLHHCSTVKAQVPDW